MLKINDAEKGEARRRRWGGLIWSTMLGIMLMVSGGFFCWWLYATWAKAGRMDHWVAVAATIEEARVETWRFNAYSKPGYEPRVRFVYDFGGQRRESTRIRRVAIRSSHEHVAERWIERFPVGEAVTAYVNPAEPNLAVLKKDSKAPLYSIWFPALFVVGGAGILGASWVRFFSGRG